MQLTDKILRERLSCLQSFLEHTHAYFAGFHIHKVLEIALTTYFAKEQQEFGLSIGESIASIWLLLKLYSTVKRLLKRCSLRSLRGNSADHSLYNSFNLSISNPFCTFKGGL